MPSTVNKASQGGVIQNSHDGQNIVHTGASDIQIVTSLEDSKPKKSLSASFRWPTPWDFSAYLLDKRKDFVGREWLFEEIEDWLAQAMPRALLIRADYGVGKSAFLSKLLDREQKCTTDGFCRVVGWHFCQHDTRETLKVSAFVSNFAAQLKDSLPEYRGFVESTPGTQEWIDKIQQDPASAFEAVILNPLSKLKALSEPRLLIIDALDESL
jgi:hypothetical protein